MRRSACRVQHGLVQPNFTSPLPPADLFRLYADAGSFSSVATVVGRDDFDSIYLPVAEQTAERLQDLPLSQNAFSARGGALQCALRSGLLAVRLCDKTIFSPTATAAERMVGDRHYRWLAYCATLGTIYLQSIAQVEVTLESGEIYSYANDESLRDLGEKFDLRWRAKATPSLARMHIFLGELWFPGQFAHLSHEMICELGLAINPTLTAPAAEPPLARVVRLAIEQTITDDIALRSNRVSSERAEPGKAPSALPASPESGDIPTLSQAVASAGLEAAANVPSEAASNRGQPAQASQPEPMSPEAVKAVEWLKAIASSAVYDGEISRQPDGKVQFSRKALSFGAAPRDTYIMLHAAGFADSKNEKSATIKASPGEIYWSIRAARGGGA